MNARNNSIEFREGAIFALIGVVN